MAARQLCCGAGHICFLMFLFFIFFSAYSRRWLGRSWSSTNVDTFDGDQNL